MRREKVAHQTGTGRITPILPWLFADLHAGEGLAGRVKESETQARAAAPEGHKLANDEELAIRRQFQVFRRTHAADDFEVPVRAAIHQRRQWRFFSSSDSCLRAP